MHNTGARSVKGNDAFEGYAVDLIKHVAEVLSKYKPYIPILISLTEYINVWAYFIVCLNKFTCRI